MQQHVTVNEDMLHWLVSYRSLYTRLSILTHQGRQAMP